jgi:hypothetical protein
MNNEMIRLAPETRVMKLASIFILSALIVASTSTLLRVLMEPKTPVARPVSSTKPLNRSMDDMPKVLLL